MKDNIPELLKQKFSLSKAVAEKFPEDIKKFMLDFSKFYSWNENLKLQTIFKLMKKGFAELPTCGVEGCNNKVTLKNKSPFITKGCCMTHTLQLSVEEKYGEVNIMKTSVGKNSLKSTMIQMYGVDNPQKSEILKNKSKATNLKKYGVEHYTQTAECHQSKKDAMMKKYGVEHALQSTEIREKTKKSNLEKYGCEYPMQSDVVKCNLENAILEKYGVSHISHHPEFHEKMQRSRYKVKTYEWKDGNISKVQGYENIVLGELEENGYSFYDVKTSKKDMPEIWYYHDGKRRRYYPDIFIPAENKLIDVKSDYTMSVDVEVNNLKAKACIDKGFIFKFEVR